MRVSYCRGQFGFSVFEWLCLASELICQKVRATNRLGYLFMGGGFINESGFLGKWHCTPKSGLNRALEFSVGLPKPLAKSMQRCSSKPSELS